MSTSIFKPGDRVREISTGDEGVVCGDGNGDVLYSEVFPSNIYVEFKTGQVGKFHIQEDEIEFVKDISVEEALTVLTKAGYSVTITKIA